MAKETEPALCGRGIWCAGHGGTLRPTGDRSGAASGAVIGGAATSSPRSGGICGPSGCGMTSQSRGRSAAISACPAALACAATARPACPSAVKIGHKRKRRARDNPPPPHGFKPKRPTTCASANEHGPAAARRPARAAASQPHHCASGRPILRGDPQWIIAGKPLPAGRKRRQRQGHSIRVNNGRRNRPATPPPAALSCGLIRPGRPAGFLPRAVKAVLRQGLLHFLKRGQRHPARRSRWHRNRQSARQRFAAGRVASSENVLR